MKLRTLKVIFFGRVHSYFLYHISNWYELSQVRFVGRRYEERHTEDDGKKSSHCSFDGQNGDVTFKSCLLFKLLHDCISSFVGVLFKPERFIMERVLFINNTLRSLNRVRLRVVILLCSRSCTSHLLLLFLFLFLLVFGLEGLLDELLTAPFI